MGKRQDIWGKNSGCCLGESRNTLGMREGKGLRQKGYQRQGGGSAKQRSREIVRWSGKNTGSREGGWGHDGEVNRALNAALGRLTSSERQVKGTGGAMRGIELESDPVGSVWGRTMSGVVWRVAWRR